MGELEQNYFMQKVINIWHKLPEKAIEAKSINEFKRHNFSPEGEDWRSLEEKYKKQEGGIKISHSGLDELFLFLSESGIMKLVIGKSPAEAYLAHKANGSSWWLYSLNE